VVDRAVIVVLTGTTKMKDNRCRTGQIDFEMSPASGLLHSRALQDVMEHAFCA